MGQQLGTIAIVVRDYDEALGFYVGVLGFDLVEDTDLGGGKRWVRVAPSGSVGATLLLAQADGPEQEAVVGCQHGGRVGFFLQTDDFARDHARYLAADVRFVREPIEEPYGTVAVFEDLYGNPWDLIQPV